MRRKINNIVSVLYTLLRFCVMKLLRGNKFSFNYIERFSPNVVFELDKGGGNVF